MSSARVVKASARSCSALLLRRSHLPRFRGLRTGEDVQRSEFIGVRFAYHERVRGFEYRRILTRAVDAGSGAMKFISMLSREGSDAK
jgi:hypothetical protein